MPYSFKHYSNARETIKELKALGHEEEMERLLLWAVGATESEARRNGLGVAPFYYGELAKLYRKRKEYDAEVDILERFVAQPRSRGAKAGQLSERLVMARQLQSDASLDP